MAQAMASKKFGFFTFYLICRLCFLVFFAHNVRGSALGGEERLATPNFTTAYGQIRMPGLATVDAPQAETPLGGGMGRLLYCAFWVYTYLRLFHPLFCLLPTGLANMLSSPYQIFSK